MRDWIITKEDNMDEVSEYMRDLETLSEKLNQEIKTLKEQLESANAVIRHVVYSTEDSQGLAYEYLELNKSKEINNEK